MTMPRLPEPLVTSFGPEFSDPGCFVSGTLAWVLYLHYVFSTAAASDAC
jgi:hypothetical protein